MKKVDLHTHSIHSDGSYTVEDLVKKVKERDLSGVSITDHDCIDAYPNAMEIGKKHDIRIMIGVELSCHEDGAEHHLLGYNVDITNLDLSIKLEALKQERKQRAVNITKKLNAVGVSLTMEHIEAFNSTGVIGRLSIAKALAYHGHAADTDDAFNKYLSPRGSAFVQKTDFFVKNAIKLIHRAGGVAVLAHPDKRLSNNKLYEFVRAGLDGIEVVHPRISPPHADSLRAFAKQYQLIQTGGSDYHGNKDYEERMFGGKFVAETVMDTIEKRCVRYR